MTVSQASSKTKRRQQFMLAPAKKLRRSIVEDPKPASLHKGKHVTPAEAQGSISVENRIREKARLIIRRKNRPLRQHQSAPRIFRVSHREIGINGISGS